MGRQDGGGGGGGIGMHASFLFLPANGGPAVREKNIFDSFRAVLNLVPGIVA